MMVFSTTTKFILEAMTARYLAVCEERLKAIDEVFGTNYRRVVKDAVLDANVRMTVQTYKADEKRDVS